MGFLSDVGRSGGVGQLGQNFLSGALQAGQFTQQAEMNDMNKQILQMKMQEQERLNRPILLSELVGKGSEAGRPNMMKIFADAAKVAGAKKIVLPGGQEDYTITQADIPNIEKFMGLQKDLHPQLMWAQYQDHQQAIPELQKQLEKAKTPAEQMKIQEDIERRKVESAGILKEFGKEGEENKPFTLGQGQKRFSAQGAEIASVEKETKVKATWLDPSDNKIVTQLEDGTFAKDGAPFTPTTQLQALGAPKEPTSLEAVWLSNWDKSNPNATPQQRMAAIEKHQKDTNAARGESFALTRGTPMLDTKAGNAPVMMNWKEINDANKMEPGRYIPATTSVPALNKTALLEDMRGTLLNTRNSLRNLKTEFTPTQRLQIAYTLKSGDPKSAVSSFMQGSVAGTLTHDQMEYITDLFQLYENGMAMRSVLGAGQGSEDMRAAIRATMPGGATPTKSYGEIQLNKIEQTLNRLQRGVPTVPLAGAKGATQTGQEVGPTVVETRKAKDGRILEKLSDGTIREAQ